MLFYNALMYIVYQRLTLSIDIFNNEITLGMSVGKCSKLGNSHFSCIFF